VERRGHGEEGEEEGGEEGGGGRRLTTSLLPYHISCSLRVVKRLADLSLPSIFLNWVIPSVDIPFCNTGGWATNLSMNKTWVYYWISVVEERRRRLRGCCLACLSDMSSHFPGGGEACCLYPTRHCVTVTFVELLLLSELYLFGGGEERHPPLYTLCGWRLCASLSSLGGGPVLPWGHGLPYFYAATSPTTSTRPRYLPHLPA